VRAENQVGDWAISSPIYVANSTKNEAPVAMLFEISNHTRFIELRKEYFLHLLATVRPPEGLQAVRIYCNDKVVHEFSPTQADQWHNQQVPVTGNTGDYGAGWSWHTENKVACHLQVDWPVNQAGWYNLEIVTTAGRTLRSQALQFDTSFPNSHSISSAELRSSNTTLTLQGYGEEMPHAEIKLPFDGDHWWYPQNTYWQLQAHFFDKKYHVSGGIKTLAEQKFRPASEN
jgi:hypothetical protein